MNAVELLMQKDANIVQRKTGNITLKLAKLDVEVCFECKELTPQQYSEVEGIMLSQSNSSTIANVLDIRIKTILNGCELFKNKDLMEHYNAPTPKELILKLLNSAEMAAISDFILNLTKVDEVSVEDIKN